MPLKRARSRIGQYNKARKKSSDDKTKKVMAVSLSLTSMVDMFAILVIFLLANNGQVKDWVQVEHNIRLPQAKASDEAKQATTLQIAKEGIFADGKQIADTMKVSKGPLVIGPLKNYLASLKIKDGYINLVGDENVPFGAMRRIITTCQDAGFPNVNLAVMPKG